MKYTIIQFKKAASVLVSAGLSESAANDLIKNTPDIIPSVLAGDLSAVPGLVSSKGSSKAASVGVSDRSSGQASFVSPLSVELPDNNIDIQAASVGSPGGASDNVADKIPADDLQALKTSSAASVRSSFDNRDNITESSVAASPVVDVMTDNNQLTESELALIRDNITDLCTFYKIDDLRKATAEQFKGICFGMGRFFKSSGILYDKEKLKTHGGSIIYNPGKVSALMEIWLELCLSFDKVPLAADFIAFSGVTSNWFYNNNGHCDLSSAGTQIWKKLLTVQESGLSSRLIDGRKNPTGTIFFLKNWHGWRDQREVIHSSGSASVGAGDLPLLGDNGGI